MPLRVAFIAAECEPWAKTGGLADVVDALARALGQVASTEIETPVDVFLPRYRSVAVPARTRRGRRITVPDPYAIGGVSEVTIIDLPADGYRLRLVDAPEAFDRDGFYDFPDDAWRFGLLCRAALETLRAEGRPPDVVHLHDWHAAATAILRDTEYADDPHIAPAAIVLTLHNLAYHGWVAADRLDQLGIVPGDGTVPLDADGIDLLREGIERAELANTVSPGFAAEALTPAFGMGLEAVLRAKGDRFLGILNGLDSGLWNPATDEAIAATFSRADRSGKLTCRRDLLRHAGFDPDDPGPIFGMIGRLDPQKGFDLLAAAAPAILELGGRLVVQGNGDPALVAGLRTLAAAQPLRVALIERFDRLMARRIYAGADGFVMPSRFEPCGTGQMIAMRYGTPPIVHRTGGLADTVIDEAAAPGQGTGFVFEDATAEDLLAACERAISLRAAEPVAWEALLDRAMAADFDWRTGSAPRYVEAYRRAVEIRARAGDLARSD